jgi:hypothetical protein
MSAIVILSLVEQCYVTCSLNLKMEKIMVCHLWMIFGGFRHPIYSVCSYHHVICFTVPLCTSSSDLGFVVISFV